VRKIVSFFHRSPKATAILKDKIRLIDMHKDKCRGKNAEHLIIDVQTRWNSTYDMCKRYLQLVPAVVAASLSNEIRKDMKETVLNEADLSNIEQALTILEPMKKITTVLSSATTPTVSLILPFKTQILATVEANEGDPPMIRDMKSAIRKDLEPR
jgi:hypothetical protein